MKTETTQSNQRYKLIQDLAQTETKTGVSSNIN
jgi:hypothetical protein